jgi:hypothetical protein
MPGKESRSFLLRIDRETLDALQRLADDELRSLNGEIEWLLREALRRNKRLKHSGGHHEH